MNLRIYAVIVAYNNPIELNQCINALLNQTYQLKGIIIIDNSSQEFQVENQSILNYIINSNRIKINFDYSTNPDINKGSAYGFYLGMEKAILKNPDFIWMNDQDGLPDVTCLERLINYFNIKNLAAIYAPQIYSIQENNKILKNFRANHNYFLHPIELSNYEVSQEIKLAGTTGILIHKDLITQCGLYNYKPFYVGLEDYEYCLRILSSGYKVFLVCDSKYYHPDLYLKYKYNIPFYSKLIRKLHLIQMVPFNMGYIHNNSNNFNKREVMQCVGSSYINHRYAPNISKRINVVYSLFRLLIAFFTSKDVDVMMTLKLFSLGRKMSKEVKN